MTNPTGDALKASAAQVTVTNLQLEAAKLALVKYNVLMPTDAAIRDMIAAATSVALPVEQAPQPTHRVAGNQHWSNGTVTRLMNPRAPTEAPPVEQTPQPVATETQPIGFMDVNGLGELVDEVRSRPAPTEAPPVESQAAEIDKDFHRAASALLNTLWQKVYSGSRTHEENWSEMDRQYPQARWLHDELKAAKARAALAAEGYAE